MKKIKEEALLDFFDRCVEQFDLYEGDLSDKLKLDSITAGLSTRLQAKILEKKIKFDGIEKFLRNQQKLEELHEDKPIFTSKKENRINLKCNKCKPGHVEANCWSKSTEKQSAEYKKCGKHGHIEENCWSKFTEKPKENQNRAENFKDTSAKVDVSRNN